MKKLTILLLLLICGCGLKFFSKNGYQYYIDKNNYPFRVQEVVYDTLEKDYIHYMYNFSFAIHLPDSHPAGTTLILIEK